MPAIADIPPSCTFDTPDWQILVLVARNVSLEAHISADGSSIAYRHGLKRMGLGQFLLS